MPAPVLAQKSFDSTEAGTPIPPVGAGHRIPALDGLRAISILMVIGFHGLNAVAQKNTGDDYRGPWLMILNGSLGVSVFFVISGFLITRLLVREVEKSGTIRLADFYLRRTFRIWPAFYAYLLAVVSLHKMRILIAGARHSIDVRDVVAAATFTFNYFPGVGNWWVAHSWSLSVEEQFYLVWPALLLWVGRKKAAAVAVALLIIAPIVRAWEQAHLPGGNLWGHPIWQTAHTRVDTLMYGCLLALLWNSPRLQSVIAFCRRWWLAVPALLMATAGSYLLGEHTRWYNDWGLHFTCEGIAIALVVAVLVTGDRRFLRRTFDHPVLVHIGRISFSLYLWQQMFMTPLNTGWTGRFPLNVLCAFAAAELSYHLIEQPALALRGRWFSKPRATATTAAVAA